MIEKPVVEARGGDFGEFPVMVGGSGAERCVLLSYTYVRVCEALGSN